MNITAFLLGKATGGGTNLDNVDYKTLDAQGDRSVALFNVTGLRADLRVWKKLYATFSFSNYLRSTHYRDYPHMTSNSFALRLMLTYKL